MFRFRPIIASGAVTLALAATIPALAWDEQGGMRSLPSGGLMLKEVPSTDSRLESLPGVRLNPQANSSDGATCTQRQVSSFGYGPGGDYQSGTLSECSFGNLTISTIRPDPRPWVPGVPSPFNN